MTIVAQKGHRIVYVGLHISKAMTALGDRPVKQLLLGDRVRGKARKALDLFNRKLHSKECREKTAGAKTHLLRRYEREVLEEMQ